MWINKVALLEQREAKNARSIRCKANAAVSRAIYNGTLVRPTVCEWCGRDKKPETKVTCVIYAHHEDYSKPLDIIWLCGSCHRKRHSPYYKGRPFVLSIGSHRKCVKVVHTKLYKRERKNLIKTS